MSKGQEIFRIRELKSLVKKTSTTEATDTLLYKAKQFQRGKSIRFYTQVNDKPANDGPKDTPGCPTIGYQALWDQNIQFRQHALKCLQLLLILGM